MSFSSFIEDKAVEEALQLISHETSMAVKTGDTFDLYHPRNSQHYYLVSKKAFAGSPGVTLRYVKRIDQRDAKFAFSDQPMVLKEVLNASEKSLQEAKLLKIWYPETEFLEIKSSNGDSACIFMPLLPGVPLFSNQDLESKELKLNLDIPSLSVTQINHLNFELALQLYILHGCAFHGDISYNNILFTIEHAFIFDLGIAGKVKDHKVLVEVPLEGTLGFMAPEIYDKRKGILSDYYALCPIVSILYGAKNPFNNKFKKVKNHASQISAIRDAEKATLYVAKDIRIVDFEKIKNPAVILFRLEGSNYQAIFVNNKHPDLVWHFVVEDEKNDTEKKSTFCMYLKPERHLVYFNQLGEKILLRNEEALLQKFKKIPDDTLKSSFHQFTTDLKKTLVTEKLGTPLIVTPDFSKISRDEIKMEALLEVKDGYSKEIAKSDEAEKILVQCFLAKYKVLGIDSFSARHKEVEEEYNLDGFFTGAKYSEWQWARPHLETFIVKLQAFHYLDRPTPLENVIFFGSLDFFGRKINPERCISTLKIITTGGIEKDEKDCIFKIFKELTNKILIKIYQKQISIEDQKIFWKAVNEFIFNKFNNGNFYPALGLITWVTYNKDEFVNFSSCGEKGRILNVIQAELLEEHKKNLDKIMANLELPLDENKRLQTKLSILDPLLQLLSQTTEKNFDENIGKLYLLVKKISRDLSSGGVLTNTTFSMFTKTKWKVIENLRQALEKNFSQCKKFKF